MSPIFAYLLVETAHYTDAKELLCAPVLSATLSLVSCCTMPVASFLTYFAFSMISTSLHLLSLGQRSRLHNLYGIADAALVVLVVSLQLVGLLYNLLVTGMLYMLLDRNHDGLIHFIAYDLADTRFSQISLHDNSPSALLRIRPSAR